MIFSEWFEEFFKTYCEGALTFGCSQEYRIIYKKHYTSLYGMELDEIKAIPHKDCVRIAQSDFSSDCTKISQAYWRMSRNF
ncbi:MAG: hypothetical protein NC253_12305, partial [Ruminococcus sp.]|nr:hypothetical protein [Ruminococcus sp.]MCM1380987.1 hypothetical protein [Muribaculaceae bacterium]